jgi:formyltetrahydrofolate synthetase
VSTKESDNELIGLDDEEMEIQDPISLALYGKKFTKISLEDIERVSTHEQSKYTGDPS